MNIIKFRDMLWATKRFVREIVLIYKDEKSYDVADTIENSTRITALLFDENSDDRISPTQK